MLVRQAINEFLDGEREMNENIPAHLYNENMEVQVMIKKDGSKPVEGKKDVYTRENSTGGTDEIWNLRIPKQANSNPQFRDYDLQWSLVEHAYEIGVTGWDWVNKVSRAVAFDIDVIAGDKHKDSGIEPAELERVREAICAIPWLEVRKSTSGGGLHPRAYLNVQGVNNHADHALLGQYVLTLISKAVGFDLAEHVDVCGGNFWIFSRRATEENEGFKLLKKAVGAPEIADNWREIAHVASGKRNRKVRRAVGTVEDIAASAVTLDDTHKAIIEWILENGWVCVVDRDNGKEFYRTHTAALAAAHEALGLRGFFSTLATGRDRSDHNAFMFAAQDGGFRVYRYGQGVKESATWVQEDKWTHCQFNAAPRLVDACKAMGAIVAKNGSFVVTADQLKNILPALGMEMELPAAFTTRQLRLQRDGESLWLYASPVEQFDNPSTLPGWNRARGRWEYLVGEFAEVEAVKFDHLARRMKLPDNNTNGFAYRDAKGVWTFCKDGETVKSALRGKGILCDREALDSANNAPWTIEATPFAPLYPGDQVWNLNGAKWAVDPVEGKHPTWDKMLAHLGRTLDAAVERSEIAEHGVTTGALYLKAWYASLLQQPYVRLPWLFFFSDPFQNTGKSTFWRAAKFLLDRGVQDASAALLNENGFNGELHGTLLNYCDEMDLSDGKGIAYKRAKKWVEDKYISIHIKGLTPFDVLNTGHFVQTANNRAFGVAETGDTRMTYAQVEPFGPGELVADGSFERGLENEAPAFLYSLLNMKLPPQCDRLGLPALETDAKRQAIVASGPRFKDKKDGKLFDAFKNIGDNGQWWIPAADGGDELALLSKAELVQAVESEGAELPRDNRSFGDKITLMGGYLRGEGYRLVKGELDRHNGTAGYAVLPPDHAWGELVEAFDRARGRWEREYNRRGGLHLEPMPV